MLINLDYERIKRGVSKNLFLRIYSVDVDTETGKWLTEPVAEGRTTTALSWSKQESTSRYYCTTYQPEESKEVRALIIHFK